MPVFNYLFAYLLCCLPQELGAIVPLKEKRAIVKKGIRKVAPQVFCLLLCGFHHDKTGAHHGLQCENLAVNAGLMAESQERELE